MQRSENISFLPPGRPFGGGRGLALLALLAAGAASCGADRAIPFLYRIEIQQGNLIEQKVLDRLQPGMSRQEVQEAMGTALLTDPFHGDRWHYVYYLRKDGSERTKRHIVLHFEDDKLVAVGGDVKPGSGNRERQEKDSKRAVRIPDLERKTDAEEQPARKPVADESTLGPETGEAVLQDIEELEETKRE